MLLGNLAQWDGFARASARVQDVDLALFPLDRVEQAVEVVEIGRVAAQAGHVPADQSEVRTTGVPFRTTDAEAQIVAVRQGLGMTTLPCFVGDADPLLVRVPGTDLHMYGTVWLLTQGETRKTKRVRLFTEFVSRRLAAYAPLLAGLSISRD